MLLWLFISWGMHNPSKIRTHTCTTNIEDEQHATLLTERILQLNGVLEVIIIVEEQTAYIKVNNQVFDLEKAKNILQNS
jgi:sensor histidine kinase regulating citrate/malate metabolism